MSIKKEKSKNYYSKVNEIDNQVQEYKKSLIKELDDSYDEKELREIKDYSDNSIFLLKLAFFLSPMLGILVHELMLKYSTLNVDSISSISLIICLLTGTFFITLFARR